VCGGVGGWGCRRCGECGECGECGGCGVCVGLVGCGGVGCVGVWGVWGTFDIPQTALVATLDTYDFKYYFNIILILFCVQVSMHVGVWVCGCVGEHAGG
jgi:hypothetical protein